MKKLFLLLCLLVISIAKAQVSYPEIPQEPAPEVQTDTVQEPEGEHIIQDYIRLYYISPSGVGNNVLAKANDGQGGFGFGLSGYFNDNVGIIVGLEVTTYNITDAAMAVNGSRTIITSPYIGGEYKLFLGKHFSIDPSLSFTLSQMRQRNSQKKLGTYSGVGIRAGATLDYAIIPNIKLFAGANFAHIWYDVDVAPQYEDYYKKVGTLNVVAGIKLAF
jgi:hypothetical protein